MLDFDKIIQSISEEHPCGVDVRHNSDSQPSYIKLKDLRNELRREERKNIEQDEVIAINKEAWEEIIPLAELILSNYSKDIEVACWLLEGLIRTKELEGFELGIDVLYLLFEKYNHQLYPSIGSDNDIDNQLGSISLLSGRYEPGTLITPIYFCSLITTFDGSSYSAWELKKIIRGNNSKLNNEITKDEILKCETLNSIIANIDQEKFQKIVAHIKGIAEKFKGLNTLLSKLYGMEAPNLSNLSGAINFCLSIVQNLDNILKNRAKAVQPQEISEVSNHSNENLISIDNLSRLQLDKAMAIKLLEMLIEFFRKSEPHSPISYTLDRVLYWSGISLPEMLCDLIPDNVRAEYCRFTGIPFLQEEQKEE